MPIKHDAFLVILLILCGSGCHKPGQESQIAAVAAAIEGSSPAIYPTEIDPKDKIIIGKYKIQGGGTMSDGGTLTIDRSGRTLVSRKGGKFILDACTGVWPAGKALSGDEIPGIAIMEWSGGAHCCFHWTFYRLGRKLKTLGDFDNDNSEDCPLVDLDGDGIPEVQLQDWTFAYSSAFDAAATFPVIYKLAGDHYILAAELMRKPVPSAAALISLSRELDWHSIDGGIPSELWTNMLDLIAGGNAGSIKTYLDFAWPKRRPGRKTFVHGFLKQLRESAHWRGLVKLNRGRIQFD
jgi:hypothetical protein